MNIHWKTIQRVFMLVFLAGASGQIALAQSDAAAKTLLDKVSEKYAGYQTVQADFTIKASQGNEQGTAYSDKGTLLMQSTTNKYHISMAEQDLISDGKSQWTVLKEVKEVHVSDVDDSSQAISPTNIFSFFDSGYKYVSAADERDGSASLHVVELSPEDPRKSQYFKIKLRINKADNLIQDVTVFDKNGTRYTYEIKNFKANPTVTPNKFAFSAQAYPGMEVVDLR